MSPDPGLSSSQVCDLTGATYRQLDYLVRTGLLRPTLAAANGSGTQRRFSRDQVPVVRLILRLRRLGAEHRHLEDVAEKLDAFSEFDWLDGFLVVCPDGTSRITADPAREVEDFAWVIALRPCLELDVRDHTNLVAV